MSPVEHTLKAYSEQGDVISVPDGTCLFQPGDAGRSFLIVTRGIVRVEQTNSVGRTVVLYRVAPGDSCVLTTSCLMSDRPYAGFGYAEGQVEAVSIPGARFRALLAKDPVFRDLVFRAFVQRVSELTDVIDDLLMHRTDLRLARWLGEQAAGEIRATQQDIAQELGTAREVVSRTLKSFEREGWITLGRGVVNVHNSKALLSHAASGTM